MTVGLLRFLAATFAFTLADLGWLWLTGEEPLSIEVVVTVCAMAAVLWAIDDLRKELAK